MRMIRTLGAGLVVALVLSLSAVGLTTSSADATTAAPAAAAHAKARDGYGAIALNAKGRFGTSKNYPSRSAAYKRALKECNKGGSKYKCVKVGWVRNACAAVWFKIGANGFVSTAAGSKPHFGWARSLSKAVSKARHGNKGGRIAKTCT